MPEASRAIARLLQEDLRYKLEAYALVFEALAHAQSQRPREDLVLSQEEEPTLPEETASPKEMVPTVPVEHHITGQQLCEAIRVYALEQYGYLAKTVLNSWGIYKTGDFGEIVYNLIRIEQMKKTASDRRSDFDDVYDFEEAFTKNFKITISE